MTINYGDPRLPLAFWAKVERQYNGCWHWTGNIQKRTGYGYVSPHGPAHRRAFHVLVRPLIPRGQPGHLQVDHECHNRSTSCQGGPTCLHRRCVNPTHLLARSPAENTHSSTHTPAALNRAKTHCERGHELAGTNLRIDSRGRRNCYTCKLERGNNARRRRLATARSEGWSKVEGSSRKTHCTAGHPLSGDNLAIVKQPNGNPSRVCRTCRKARSDAFYRSKQKGHVPRGRGAELTHCVNGHEFTEENTYRAPGSTARQCRTCRREGKRRRREAGALD